MAKAKSEAVPTAAATLEPLLQSVLEPLPGEAAVPKEEVGAKRAEISVTKPRKSPVAIPFYVPPILLEGDEPELPQAAGVQGGERGATRQFRGIAESEEPSELPEAYGTGWLFLVMRDPHCLYAHWDLPPEEQRRYNGLASGKHLTLRVHRGTASGELVSEFHVHPESQHWFVHVPAEGCYVAALGYYEAGDKWVNMCWSEPTSTAGPQPIRRPSEGSFPVSVVSPRKEPKPVLEPSKEAVLPGPAPSARVVVESRTDVLREAASLIFGFAAAGVNQAETHENRTAVLPGAEPDMGAGLPSLPVDHRAEEAKWLTAMPKNGEPASLVPELQTGALVEPVWEQTPAPSQPEPWLQIDERAFGEVLAMAGMPEAGPVSEAVSGLPGGELPGQVSSAAGQPVPLAMAQVQPEAAIFSPLESQPEREARVAGGGFWFDVNTELVVYGATEPSAQVKIGGRPIRLRTDGTFSYRFALPDGDYELAITAVSRSGDERHATLKFRRSSTYQGEVGAHPQEASLKVPAAQNTG